MSTKPTRRVLSQTSVNGKVVRTTTAMFNQTREHVPVKHALRGRQPHYNDDAVRAFAKNGLVPLTEVSYWLTWGNQNRVNEGERGFDLPTADALRSLLEVVKKQYTPAETVNTGSDAPDVPSVRHSDFSDFLQQAAAYDRATLMRELDLFVGRHLQPA